MGHESGSRAGVAAGGGGIAGNAPPSRRFKRPRWFAAPRRRPAAAKGEAWWEAWPCCHPHKHVEAASPCTRVLCWCIDVSPTAAGRKKRRRQKTRGVGAPLERGRATAPAARPRRARGADGRARAPRGKNSAARQPARNKLVPEQGGEGGGARRRWARPCRAQAGRAARTHSCAPSNARRATLAGRGRAPPRAGGRAAVASKSAPSASGRAAISRRAPAAPPPPRQAVQPYRAAASRGAVVVLQVKRRPRARR
jgi:hypothetical protein